MTTAAQQALANAMSEADLQNAIVDLAARTGWMTGTKKRTCRENHEIGSLKYQCPGDACDTSGLTRKDGTPVPQKRTTPRICAQCGVRFFAYPSDVKRGHALFCSVVCLGLSRRRPLIDRLLEKVIKHDSGCWIWTGYRNPSGHGRMYGGPDIGRAILAHRASYELLVGQVPQGKELDHLCGNPSCVNPEHLEPVTHAVNVYRGNAPTVVAHRRGTCQKGHPINEQNTVFRRGTRAVVYCKVCRREKRAQQRIEREGFSAGGD